MTQFEHVRKMMKGMMEMQDRVRAAGLGPDASPGAVRAAMTTGGISASERARRLQRKQFEKKMRQQQAKKARQKKK